MLMTLFLGFFVSAASASHCPVQGDACDFYCESEGRLACGADNYLTRFGADYCRRFLQAEPYFSIEGMVFLPKVRACLIHKLQLEDLTCENTRTIALDSHVDCYVDNGFCSLPFRDATRILSVVWTELRQADFRAVMSRIDASCVSK